MKNTVNKIAVAAMVAAAASVGFADTFRWNPSGSGSWADSRRWLGEDGSAPAARAPDAGDTVVVSAATANVTDDDQGVISKIAEIQLEDQESSVVFDTGTDFSLSCPVQGKGLIVKRGDGKLFLGACKKYFTGDGQTANNCLSDHFTGKGIKVEKGWVVAPQSSGSGKRHIVRLEVLEDGVFQMINDNYQVFVSLKGNGTVTNDS
jgi:hypothetical protein